MPCHGRFTPGKETQYSLYGRLLGTRASVDGGAKKLTPNWDSIPGSSSL